MYFFIWKENVQARKNHSMRFLLVAYRWFFLVHFYLRPSFRCITSSSLGRYFFYSGIHCPFCKQHSATVDHVFLYCSSIRHLWTFFASELHGKPPTSLNLRQYLLSWWYRSTSSSLFGVLKIVTPAIIVYNIWRSYAQLVYGNSASFSISVLRASIHFDIDMWIQTIQGSKLAAGPSFSLSWIPHIRSPHLQVVRWQTPPSGRLKLNIDAAVDRHYASGGAILRDHFGTCVSALSFHLPPCTPLMAEIQATVFGLLYFLPLYRSLIIESDCAQMLSCLRQPQTVFGNYHLRFLQTLIRLHRLEITHTYREANTVAQYLAQHAMMFPRTCYFTSSSLPPMVRASITLDLTSSSLRTHWASGLPYGLAHFRLLCLYHCGYRQTRYDLHSLGLLLYLRLLWMNDTLSSFYCVWTTPHFCLEFITTIGIFSYGMRRCHLARVSLVFHMDWQFFDFSACTMTDTDSLGMIYIHLVCCLFFCLIFMIDALSCFLCAWTGSQLRLAFLADAGAFLLRNWTAPSRSGFSAVSTSFVPYVSYVDCHNYHFTL